MEMPSSHAGAVKELKVKWATRSRRFADPHSGQAPAKPMPLPPRRRLRPAPARGARSCRPQHRLRRRAGTVKCAARKRSPLAGRCSPLAAGPSGLPHASPSVRKFARELGVDSDPRQRYRAPRDASRTEDVQGLCEGRDCRRRFRPREPRHGLAAESALDRLPWPSMTSRSIGPTELTAPCRASRRSPVPVCIATGS